MSQDIEVDLELDLNSEDDTGLPWGFVDEASNPTRIREGSWIAVGSGTARAVAGRGHRRRHRPRAAATESRQPPSPPPRPRCRLRYQWADG